MAERTDFAQISIEPSSPWATAKVAERLLWVCALAAVIFFARWRLIGLQPDAALYAGLSLKVLRSGEAWLLSGTDGRFPEYFEHPPYFFQWGAWLLSKLGVSDGAARAIGGLPASFGFVSLVVWTWRRFSWGAAALVALMLASFGHYTKYAATSMLEGPLSLGVVWVAIASYELHWRPSTGWRRPILSALLVAGLLLATASKGVAGLGAWGGLVLSLGFALLFSERPLWKLLFSSLFVWVWLLVALAPLAFWAWRLISLDGASWILGYLQGQVLTSVTSNRGDLSHATKGDPLFFVRMILLNGWPWWWTVPAGWLASASLLLPRFRERPPRWSALRDLGYRGWSWHAAAFFLAFFVPFSLVSFQLAHYIHPTYLVLAPCGAYALAVFIGPRLERWSALAWPRWLLVLLIGAALGSTGNSVSAQANRGQPFIALREKLSALAPQCRVLVTEDGMDAYRMEAYALWYWEARAWERVEHAPASAGQVPPGSAFWNPADGRFWPAADCVRRTKK